MQGFVSTATVWTEITLLLVGAVVTVCISAAAIAIGMALAVPVCIASMAQTRALQWMARTYISVFRGVPLLIQLLVFYYLLPFIGLGLPSVVAGTLALALCTSAYQAENLRGGVMLVPAGQASAAQAFGYSPVQIWQRILLPQAVRFAAPVMINEMISILKASSLVSVVGITDLTRVAQNLVARNMQPITWYAFAALVYLVINLALSYAGRRAARRLGRGYRDVRL